MDDNNPAPSALPLPPGAFACGAKDHFEPAGATAGWRVHEGMVDVFLVGEGGAESGFRRHLLRVEAGSTLFGAARCDAGVHLQAVPGNNSVLLPFDLSSPAARGADLSHSLAAWITAVADAIAARQPPAGSRLLPEDPVVHCEADSVLAGGDEPVWLVDIPPGASYAGLAPFGAADRPRQLPLTRLSWSRCPPERRSGA